MMELEELRVFDAVARHLHFTKAGREVGLSQPAVSYRVQALERRLGTTLVQRVGRTMHLTPAGEVLAEEAARVLRRLEAAAQAVEEVKGLLRGRLRVGASTTPGVYLVPRAAARFAKRFPGVTLEVTVDNTLAIEEAVLNGDVHAAVVGGHLARRDLLTESLCDDELVVFAAPDHPLAKKRSVDLDAVLEHPFAMRERGSATRDTFTRWLADHERVCQVGVEFGSPEAVKHAVAEGPWLGVLSRISLRWELDSKRVREVKVKRLDLRRRLQIVRHSDTDAGRLLDEWVAVVKEVAAE